MEQKYNNLEDMLQQNNEANALFNSLPEYVQEMIRDRGEGVQSMTSLSGYVHNLTRGDN